MELIEYLRTHNLSVYQFSSLCKISAPVIYRMLNNKKIAKKSAKKVFFLTKGEVDYPYLETRGNA